MTYLQLAYAHMATVLPSFLIGSYLLLNKKGTPVHKMLGKLFMLLMLMTAATTLLMPAEVGPRLFNHFGFIHLLSLLVLYSIPAALFAIRAGNVQAHRSHLLGVYVGGILIAGAFTFLPGRLLNTWIFG